MRRAGNSPYQIELVVVTGQDFIHYFAAQAADQFPDPTNTQVSLHIFDGPRQGATQLGWWPAVLVEEAGAQVQIDAEDLDRLPPGCWFRLFVAYHPGPRTAWFRGPVRRED